MAHVAYETPPLMAPALLFRRGKPHDLPTIVELIYGAPGLELAAVIGDPMRAQAFGMALAPVALGPESWDRTVLVEEDARVVGTLVWRTGAAADASVTPRLAWDTLRTLGPRGALRMARYDRLRRLITPPDPPGAYFLDEIHVRPERRGEGIGRAILDYAERQARAAGFPRMALTTATSNPARRLYERCGFKVVATYKDRDYERLTGVAGRHLMVKAL